MQHWAKKDADDQHKTRVALRLHKYCETECFFPDVCQDSKYREHCVLKKLCAAIDAPWWLKLVGRRFVPAYPYTETDSDPLNQIRKSQYYEGSQEQEKRLLRIWKHGCFYEPQLCRIWSRELLGMVDDRCWVCGKRAEWYLHESRKENTRYDWWTNPKEYE
jgi:hypothetical protein